MKYWTSWYHESTYGPFEINSPWWWSGENIVCAAIKTELNPEQYIYKSYDNKPKHIEFRFIEKQEDSWSPFCDRFKKSDWMQWE